MMVSLVSSDFSVSFSFRGLGHRFQLQTMLLTLSGLCTPLLQGEHFSKQNSLASWSQEQHLSCPPGQITEGLLYHFRQIDWQSGQHRCRLAAKFN
jgi:hypothetical protein